LPAGPENTSRISDQSGVNPQDVETDVGCTKIDRAVAPFSQHPAPMLHARDSWDTAIVDSPSPEIADSNDGTDKRPSSFVFDVFAEDDDCLVNDVQPRAKRRRRASSASLWPMGQFSRSDRTTNLCDNEAFFPPRKFLPNEVLPCY
jgi:hypothetical protein